MGNYTIGTNVDGLADLNPIRYRGYYYDKETQLYYLQTRYYDPEIGQFISPDTQNYLDPQTIGGLTLSAYCFNNPVMGFDPTGHDAIVLVEDGLPILKHIVVYVQDEEGKWYRTDYNNFSEVSFVEVSDVEADMKREYAGKKYESTRIKGNYHDSVKKAEYYEKNEFGSYNLLFNSCQTYALTILREGTAQRAAVNKYIQGPRAGITAIPSVFYMNLNAIVEEDAGNHIPRKEAEPVSKALYFTFGLLAFNPIFGLAVAGFYLHHHIVNGG